MNWTHWLEGVGVFGQISVIAWANKNTVVYSSVLRFIYSLCIFCFYMGFVLQVYFLYVRLLRFGEDFLDLRDFLPPILISLSSGILYFIL